MKVIERQPKPIEHNDYLKRSALTADCKEVIDFDCLITTDGVPMILYVKIKEDLKDLEWAVKNVKYGTGARTLGLKSTSTIFGYSPKLTVRRDYCSSTAMARELPKQHNIISSHAALVSKYYKQYFPEKYAEHEALITEKVLDNWRIPGSIFTSGIVNKNSQLKYHHDAGNFKDCMSNMIVLKSQVAGGHLAVPEYDLYLEVADHTLVVFNGQNIMHGVTPIKYLSEDAYRYSIVYYSLLQMWKCLTPKEELKRIRQVKLEREKKRLKSNAV